MLLNMKIGGDIEREFSAGISGLRTAKKNLFIETQTSTFLKGDVDVNMLQRLQKSLSIVNENMLGYKTLSVRKDGGWFEFI